MRALFLMAGTLVAMPVQAAPVVHASASCVAANKPGRIRCRALVELPLDAVATQKIAWGQLVIVSSDPSVTPLRGRLGPNDAEVREDGRLAWSFSVAASEVGERTMKVRLSSTIEPKNGGPSSLVTQDVDVTVRVSP
ncbi:MAG: hypothetical protein ACXVEF_44320 [Polyangiales bacterium]